jgi:predicted DNA-binding protein (UPF0251 family)
MIMSICAILHDYAQNTTIGESVMGRPQLWRRVSFVPPITYFKPAGIPLVNLQEVHLLVEEAEAIRLKDVDGLEQEECAEKMNISRSTFSRILDSARQKIADALLNGKAIRIEGGNFEMAVRRFRCISGHEWDVPFESLVTAPPELCPKCDTPSIMPLLPPGMGWGRGGWGRRRRGGRSQ